ncbi:Tumor susceptibility gene 101 protein [Neolecta irregularis DAH-3]|uniref:Tumor susceptibility gene 101 protein n=1 Tax=Neolecta irregularis (strain DAH-3) TaxID=1198029 RepID=A0A1U7LNJ2_NEOID|nr:Tumor susceptibility gene 101 protein [Neolecta irregularis DAH-3]|eukprot:OLL24112.1 Tumor susceptibility gene 101 protein [Neolecta irregularis DAH-3]
MNLASIFGKEPPLYAQSSMEKLENRHQSTSLEEGSYRMDNQSTTINDDTPMVPHAHHRISNGTPIPLSFSVQDSNQGLCSPPPSQSIQTRQSPPPIPPAPHRQPRALKNRPPPYQHNNSPIPELLPQRASSSLPHRPELTQVADTSQNAQVRSWLQDISIQSPSFVSQDIIDEQTPSPADVAPPPKPPNPERTILLKEVADRVNSRADSLCRDLQDSISEAKRYADAIAVQQLILDREVSELNRIDQLCDKNMNIFHDRIQQTDEVIKECENREWPDIDQVLVAQTVVYNQLYNLVAEDLAIEDLLYILAKGLDRERIELDVFMKFTRNLAREQFMKKALIKKICESTGLDM